MRDVKLLEILADKTSAALIVRQETGIVNYVCFTLELSYLALLAVIVVRLIIPRFKRNQTALFVIRCLFAVLTFISGIVCSFFAAGFYCFNVSDTSQAQMISSETNLRWWLLEILFVWSCVGMTWLVSEVHGLIHRTIEDRREIARRTARGGATP